MSCSTQGQAADRKRRSHLGAEDENNHEQKEGDIRSTGTQGLSQRLRHKACSEERERCRNDLCNQCTLEPVAEHRHTGPQQYGT